MILFWHASGPKLSYTDGTLEVEDLNPEAKVKFRMTRMEMLRLGWRCIVAGLSPQ